MTDDQTPDNLNALRYLAGEMTAEESQAFETLLAQGGPACDALADMVILERTARATRGVIETSTAKRGAANNRRIGMLGKVAACAAVLATAVTLILVSPPGRHVADSAADGLSASELAALANAWSDLRPVAVAETEREDVELLADTAMMDVPDWMLTAVSVIDDKAAEKMIEMDEEGRL